jgi:hypothetical protein
MTVRDSHGSFHELHDLFWSVSIVFSIRCFVSNTKNKDTVVVDHGGVIDLHGSA